MRHKRTRPAARGGAKHAPSGHGKVRWLTVVGARQNNLKEIDVHIPLGRFVCVTGVSGSGKSSLVNDILYEQLARDLNGAENTNPGAHRAIRGKEHLDKVIDIDQSPIGRTPRSNPATYIKVFDLIRDLFARLPDSKLRGYKPGRFSFNVSVDSHGGRCEACEGNGANKMEMDFLADVWVPCPLCEGKRFSHETLQVRYKGKNIADVLDMEVAEALRHFQNIPRIKAMLRTLHDVGLDYIKLGQSSTTLSGGEAQRIKLARELVKVSTGRTLYLLDEPTTGLHFDDILKLLSVLHGLVDAGNTVVVIEHNLDVIKTADWIIDLGPEGGEGGGYVIATGTPETVAKTETHTGRALRSVLAPKSIAPLSETQRSRQNRPPKPAGDNGRIRTISVVGARQHNLKNITVDVPREKMTVCCGLSGSGKSSFAVDTVYTEGQRRYVESLSAYARQFLGQLQKPKVDRIDGLSPAISIEQKAAARSPRSTVGTVTEIYDYMRVLWARIGQAYCPHCHIPIGAQTVDEIVDRVIALPEGTRALLLAPIDRQGTESYTALLDRQKANGFTRVRIDGEIRDLGGAIDIDRRRRHTIEVIVDRIIIRPAQRARIAESVEMALSVGSGTMGMTVLECRDHEEAHGAQRSDTDKTYRFSRLFSCERCGRSFDELTPHHFSFNSRLGWCPSCEGLGTQTGSSADAIIAQPNRSIADGAIHGWDRLAANPTLMIMVSRLADHIGLNLHRPWNELPSDHQAAMLYGTGNEWIPAGGELEGVRFQWKGFFPAVDEAAKAGHHYRAQFEQVATEVACRRCGGSRLRPEAAAVRVGNRTITDVCSMTLDKCLAFFEHLPLNHRQRRIAGELLHEITSRLRFLIDVGLEYVTLHRPAPTLSGGESQRIRLAGQIGSGLTGVLYVLDEPTIGLHPRDNARLVAALGKLRDLGNTLLLVEHDRQVIDHADHLLDFGPGAGVDGGRIVAAGSPKRVRSIAESLTGKYLVGKEAIAVPTHRRPVDASTQPDARTLRYEPDESGEESDAARRAGVAPAGGQDGRPHPTPWLTVVGARRNNLKNVDVAFPLGRFTVVTGVSGSGKSSLVTDILYPALARRIHLAQTTPGPHQEILGIELIDKVINVDQQPIGNSPSSNPATYTGVFDLIRELFAKLPDSKVRGYTAERFSFNRPGGRCEGCEGNGQVCYEMHFLPDVWVDCDECGGKRYNTETLAVRYRGKNIADVLEMRVSEALRHFEAVPKVRRMLQTLADVGLDYVALGQPAPTLSGGEAQRVNLAAELGRPTPGRTIYILDEPTTGLHFHDLRKLLDVLNRLVDMGNTVICIEHNMDVIKTADWVVDLGPEAGEAGGYLVAAGTPEDVARCRESHTGRILADVLAAGPYAARPVFDAQAYAAAELEAQKLIPDDIGEAAMPWQRDGRTWHTRMRRDRQGQPIRWEPAALEFVVDRIAELGGDRLAKPDWNHQARVEIRAPNGKIDWFFHALTGGEWLLDLTFRVPNRRFKQADLETQLGLKTLDERTDLPIYGQWSRVNVKRANPEMDRVRILVHDKAEIATPGFDRFLREAIDAYGQYAAAVKEDPRKAEPWKTDGKAWHLEQRRMTRRYKATWQGPTLLQLIGTIRKAVGDLEVDWNHKIAIELGRKGAKDWWCRIVTAHTDYIELMIRAKNGQFTPVMIEKLGQWREIRRNEKGGDIILIRFQTMPQLDPKAFSGFLKACDAGWREVSSDTKKERS